MEKFLRVHSSKMGCFRKDRLALQLDLLDPVHGACTACVNAVSILGFAGFTGGRKAVPATALLTMVLWPLALVLREATCPTKSLMQCIREESRWVQGLQVRSVRFSMGKQTLVCTACRFRVLCAARVD